MRILSVGCAIAAFTCLSPGTFGIASAAELPETQVKVIGLSSGAVASTEDEVPFWNTTIPETSAGQISVNFLPIDQTGVDSKSLLRLLQLGASDFISIETSKLAGDDPRFEGCDIAGITQTLVDVKAACDAYRDVLDEMLATHWNAKLLAIGYQPPQVFWCATPLEAFADISGKKVRVFNPTMADIVEAFDGTPVEIAFSEVVPALQRRVVDCGVTGTLTGNTSRWPEVATHIVEVPMGWAVYLNLVSLETWNKFAPELQAYFLEEFANFESKMFDTAAAAISDAEKCNYGGECDKGIPADMTKVALTDADIAQYEEVVQATVLKNWAARCGAECAEEWNATVGAATGLTMPVEN